ncbi:MAG: MarR family winged helix-turn-helix transcriptional regulator [Gammaproteobacteria bacterium]|nr:MarR family winged helix-turn-helix transcriptional regulator [Gammaproteobacteria bacterium]MBU2057703.1 MarR family winged helix-turn-helix transcriptional regulator [Gammaproteobacteria bacterium]MBU2176403.1 MarR family winged helix-turn-helix transcriptional regulator [Gammaproteobacteria bacterium]MBU2246700.1 MarR family winged helix-turn-helix transcriptional regulator [Gammaproteobacteria bacterium]MBU2345076.1 MarR family winged helix-turn-helix transcriptional regulator [Gammaprot
MKTTTKDVCALEDHLGFWLRFVSNHVSGRFEKLIAAHGLTVSEWVALRTLYNKAESTHAELIEALGMTKSAASKVVTRLETKGLACRISTAHSAREQRIGLTAQGRSLVPVLASCADENEQFFFGHLDLTTKQALQQVMIDLTKQHQLTQVPVE